MKWRLLNTGYGNVYSNMALDEAIFLCRKKNLISSTIRFYGWTEPAITFGYFQQLDTLKNIFKEYNLPFARRMTGGGAVFHHKEVTFGVVCLYNEVSIAGIRESHKRISRAVISGLRKLGLESDISEAGPPKARFCFSAAQPGDVVIKNKKLAGGAQRRSSGVLLHQGSILLEKNKDFTKFYDGGTSLAEATGKKMAFDEIEKCIVHGLKKEFGIIPEREELTEHEVSLAEKLIEKYKSPEWNNRY